MINGGTQQYEPIAVSDESTVVSEFPLGKGRSTAYQSEAQLENEFIRQLQSQAYEYLPIKTEEELVCNLRRQIERLNDITFSDGEWKQFFGTCISDSKDSIVEKTKRIQQEQVQLLTRDDGSTKNVRLLDTDRIHNNRLQVINQYEAVVAADSTNSSSSKPKRLNRYDVTILVNGLPLVHIELKRRGVELRQAFNQIDRYQRDSFWADSGLFEYVQLFVISNGTLTKYYSNTVRSSHLNEARTRFKPSMRKTSNSYSFTSWWADAKNQTIRDLLDFTQTFFAKHTLLNILTKYCVFDVDKKLLVMRPYQIAAVEQILQRIKVSDSDLKRLGKTDAGGYIWHATGSGKTLTSFKAAQLIQAQPDVDKVLFVVDRKDLDYQTMREYDKFEKGAANSNQSTTILRQQLEDTKSGIIITTVQKLSRFVTSNAMHSVYDKRCVIIFDECHRSQFGKMHADITRSFKRYHLFGFTGTPIFTENASTSRSQLGKMTTEQVFGDKLHAYTIVDAINDKNVLPFRIDYINTVKGGGAITNKSVAAIDTECALLDPKRIQAVVGYIREHFDQKTRRRDNYRLSPSTNLKHGFNSIFAVASINAAKAYYAEFVEQQKNLPSMEQLKIGLIYSYSPNEDLADGQLDEEHFETEQLPQSDRDFLEYAINDYNACFKTNFDTSADKFQNYYKDISQRLKNRDLDLVIVVNMFLTGFDATTLNTLWLDKKLRSHGLLQAYSRTNRILNSIKSYGNIVSFRNLDSETNEALALFGNEDALSIAILPPFDKIDEKYRQRTAELKNRFQHGEPIIGEAEQRAFVVLFSEILKLRNVLVSFDKFEDDKYLSEREFQDYQSTYLEHHQHYQEKCKNDREHINDDLCFEIELIKQVEINVDYILMLVEESRKSAPLTGDPKLKETVLRAVAASPTLRDKRDLIKEFVENISGQQEGDVRHYWRSFVNSQKESELDKIIREHNLMADATKQFMENAFRDDGVPETGTEINAVLPPMSRFVKKSQRDEKKRTVLDLLIAFFTRFKELG